MIIYYEIVCCFKCVVCYWEIDIECYILGVLGCSLFWDLMENEIWVVGYYLYFDKIFNFMKKRFVLNFCYLYNIELLLFNKMFVLEFFDFLDSFELFREVCVVLFCGDKLLFVVEEYVVGLLINIEYYCFIVFVFYRFRLMLFIENWGVWKLMK